MRSHKRTLLQFELIIFKKWTLTARHFQESCFFRKNIVLQTAGCERRNPTSPWGEISASRPFIWKGLQKNPVFVLTDILYSFHMCWWHHKCFLTKADQSICMGPYLITQFGWSMHLGNPHNWQACFNPKKKKDLSLSLSWDWLIGIKKKKEVA